MTPKQFIEQLFAKRSDYADPDQAELAANLLDTVSTDIYSESQRFVFELIQNADDAAADTGNEVHFDFIDGALLVSHNGMAFSEADISSLTNAGSSTKKSDPTKTGYKGIGFKSVFGKSERVSIFSNGYQFRFEKSFHGALLPWQVIPIWTEFSELSTDIRNSLAGTSYQVNTVIETDQASALEEEIKELLANGQILLFLRRVNKITVSRNRVATYSVEKKQTAVAMAYQSVSLLINGDMVSSWIVKTFAKIKIPSDTKQELKKDEKTPVKLKLADFTEMSFAAQIQDGKIKALGRDESLVFTYLPTKVSNLNFPFLINGSFLTNAPREALHEDRIWNQWLMKLTAEKLIHWLKELAGSAYQYQLLQLVPEPFVLGGNELKTAFNSALHRSMAEVAFIPSLSGTLMKASELIVDRTGLSALDFIDPETVIQFINREQGTKFTGDSFLHTELKHKDRLQRWGATIFDIDRLEPFFLSVEFTNSHQAEDNFALIAYFKAKCSADVSGEWQTRLKNIPFIISEEDELKSPAAICFPSIAYKTEFGASVTTIDERVYSEIENNPPVKEWLGQMGVKDPSDEAYLENELIGNIGTAVNEANYMQVTRYLFDKHKNGGLNESHYERLKEFKLYTTTVELQAAKQCYLSDFYEPLLRLEQVNKVLRYVTPTYKRTGDMVSEWKTFLLKLGVVQDIRLQNLALTPTEAREKYPAFVGFFDENRTQKYNASNGFTYLNPISKYELTTYSLLEFATDSAFAKLFWERAAKTNFRRGASDTGLAYYQNSVYLQNNFFEWCLQRAAIFPTSLDDCRPAAEVFLNDKETLDLAGKFLPVFDHSEPLSEEWKKLICFKKQLALEDLLEVLERMASQMKEGELLSKADERRLGLIYNKLEAILPDMSAEHKALVSDWAAINYLPATSLLFEPVTELKLVKIAGFNTSSDKLKVMLLPANCRTNTPDFEALMTLLGIKVIDQFIPSFGIEPVKKEFTLKRKLAVILPYLAAVSERKRFTEFDEEYKRIKKAIERCDLFVASEIKLTFMDGNEVIEGPSLNSYKAGNELYFKGRWKSPLTMFVLIPELTALLDLRGLNEDLRLLLELDEPEIKDYFTSLGLDFDKREFMQTWELPLEEMTEDDVPPSGSFTLGNGGAHGGLGLLAQSIAESPETEFADKAEPFVPQHAASSLNMSTLSVQKRSFTAFTSAPADVAYTIIASDVARSQIGYWSEELVYHFLLHDPKGFTSIVWVNEHEESGLPYDISYIENGVQKFIDAKGTPSGSKDVIYLSDKEWVFMFKQAANYAIYRVYRAGFGDARIITVENPAALIPIGEILPEPITLKV
jgi:hypothetical protein